ncbi:hypothetical protein [Planococcus sp. YIM B11945]|uniref:hypothetical protein n=1 Tax=Planococcus sp. YIM B11945 TaxID=3435410 RepID=UPI003D7E9D76
MGDILAGGVVLFPFLLGALVLRWLRIIRINSEKQVEQNQEIITLLKSGARMKEKGHID